MASENMGDLKSRERDLASKIMAARRNGKDADAVRLVRERDSVRERLLVLKTQVALGPETGGRLEALDVLARKTAHNTTRTIMDTIVVTPDQVRNWMNPSFQRPYTENEKVRKIATTITETEVIPGVITLGLLDGVTYKLDGQHRIEAFLASGLDAAYCDVRMHHVLTMDQMATEFSQLNSSIAKMRPDDYLRALESSSEALELIREECPFVGYDMIRRGPASPVLSMSLVLRSWHSSGPEVPRSSGTSVVSIAESLSPRDASSIVDFLRLAMRAWGRDSQYWKLWGGLNLTIVMWLYRRVVLTDSKRAPATTPDLFCKCLMSLSLSSDYLSWLVGRSLGDRDRSPAYARIKSILVDRMQQETGKRPRWPQPAWAS